SALDRRGVNVTQHHFAATTRTDLRDAMTHGARAEHTNVVEWASRGFVVFVRFCTQRMSRCGRTSKVDAISGHDVAGAWLVRLTRTALVILYAQPKTRIHLL